MPDYAACRNEECLTKRSCCRYLMDIKDSTWQTMVLVTGNGEDCGHYWPVEDTAPFRLRKLENDG